ncbi:hypothetical protein VTJ83DRAFT_1252 [Remersonia thermophila]|uniref:Synaptobrevin n=1 Tax=Remersonia thermophila TaxID=72144 RepID=A0ABR4DPC4_9PEZI
MARVLHGAAISSAPRGGDPLADLSLLLSRLQRTILHADAEREARLRKSEFEREKAHANISYARTLLAKLEQDASSIKVPRRQDLQADLLRKRDLLDQLSERLNDLAEFAAAAAVVSGDASGGDGDEDTSDGEDILADIIATPSASLDSSARSPDTPPQEVHESQQGGDSSECGPDPLELPSRSRPEEQHPSTQPTPQPQPQPQPQPPEQQASAPQTTTSQTLRSRQPHQPSSPPSSSSTTAATAPATSAAATPTPTPPAASATTTATSLFGSRAVTKSSASSTAAAAAAVSTTEAILDHQRVEQDALSESILKLAAELKASSHAFSASLDEDRALVERAGRGMERTGEQMSVVSRRMGALQRMAEEEGWLGRMKLYAMVYGLMVVLVLVVFVLPKLRF